jgi:hypothetical protein
MILWLLACKAPEETGEPHPVPHEMSLDDLEKELRFSFDAGLPSMLDVSNAYKEIMSQSDEICPMFSPTSENGLEGHWVDNCTSIQDATFFGFCQFYDIDGELSPEEDLMFGSIWASFEVFTAEGIGREVGGIGLIGADVLNHEVNMRLDGTFWMSDDVYWMQAGSQSLDIGGDPEKTMTINGGVQYPELSLFFNEMKRNPQSCDGGIQGELRIRDTSGYWFTMERRSCAPCSDIFWGEKNLGEFCIWESLDASIAQWISDFEPYLED